MEYNESKEIEEHFERWEELERGLDIDKYFESWEELEEYIESEEIDEYIEKWVQSVLQTGTRTLFLETLIGDSYK